MNKERFNMLFLTLPIPAQNKEEFWWLLNRVEKIHPSSILEIGIDKGGSFKFWAEMIKENGLLIGVDDTDKLEIFKNKEEMTEYLNFNLRIVLGNSSDISTLQKVKEQLVFSGINYSERLIDFLFIDGSHGETVWQDYKNYSPFVREGGIIAFHDCGETSVNYAEYHHVPVEETSSLWERGGAPQVKKCFESIKGKIKERIQFDQGTGIIYM